MNKRDMRQDAVARLKELCERKRFYGDSDIVKAISRGRHGGCANIIDLLTDDERLTEDDYLELLKDAAGDYQTMRLTYNELARMYDLMRAQMKNDMVDLPMDANGEVIHVGDEMVCGDHVFTVNGIGWEHDRGEVFYMTEDGCDVCNASLCRHRKPTVEDVLLGFVIALDKRMHLSNGVATTIAEYAPKLQVREDE